MSSRAHWLLRLVAILVIAGAAFVPRAKKAPVAPVVVAAALADR